MKSNNYLLLGIFLALSILVISFPIASSGVGETVIVQTQLTVGEVFPMILNMSINSDINITLTPNTTTTVSCTALIQDWNNDTDISKVNATFYDISASTWNDLTPDNNDHYVNTSCNINLDTEGNFGYVEDQYHAIATCNFEVEYYANPNVWNCSMFIVDSTDRSNINEEQGGVDPLLAIGLPDVIDYGIVDSITVSDEEIANVSNAGNVLLNLSLEGYAVTQHDGLAMNCSAGTSNITIEDERYNLTGPTSGGIDYATNYSTFYTNLTSVVSKIREFNLDYRINDAIDDTAKSSYWRIYVPQGAAGTCQGNILFGAVQAPASA